ncbi:MAG: hypothetical protein MI865_04535, partial [Proteobacteria bacterium]|nr:hypothetical protein [Pseudomonadota bacterium]
MNIAFKIFLFFIFIIPVAHADSAAIVKILQSPVWLERNGNQVSLTIGDELFGKDKIVTGTNARVLLRLNDDSVVKLGENAEFIVEELISPKQEGDVLSG